MTKVFHEKYFFRGLISPKSCNFAPVKCHFLKIFAVLIAAGGNVYLSNADSVDFGSELAYGSGELVRSVARAEGITLPLAPIIKSVRGQGEPFNRACPYYIYDDGMVSGERSLVGCVATSAEQVLSHYRYPEVLMDSIAGFSSANNGDIATVPKGTPIDFENILDIYTPGEYSDDEAQAVANLSYYLGVACRMNWAVGSSGAQVGRLVEPLRRAFGYGYVRYLRSYDYTPQRWLALLLRELAAGRPVIYAGYSTQGSGHAFVIDGVDRTGRFHVSWGFGGNWDGYFDLAILNTWESPLEPTATGCIEGLGHMQEALFLHPDSVAYVIDDTLSTGHRVAIDNVSFNRNPDTNIGMLAEVKVRNVSDVDMFAPIELFTYTRLDSLGNPADVDYLGLADGIVRAHVDTTLVAFVSCSAVGERLLGINMTDSMYLAYDTITVQKASQPKLSFVLADSVITARSASFTLSITNQSPTYWSGRMVTYSLFEGEYTEAEGDLRHYKVLNLQPGGSTGDAVSFRNLEPNTDYTFVVRNPWQPAMQVKFRTPLATAVQSEKIRGTSDKRYNPSYRLNHRITIEYDESTGRYRQVLSR